MIDYCDLQSKLNSIVVFRNLLRNPLFKKLKALIDVQINEDNVSLVVSAYCQFIQELYKGSENLTEYILELILKDENSYVVKRGAGIKNGMLESECLANELSLLEEIGKIPCDEFISEIHYNGFLPRYEISNIDYSQIFAQRLLKISSIGYGVYSTHHVFVMTEKGLSSIDFPDPITLSQLSGYEMERGEVISNTLALLKGKPANNCLLYGDCGTGKSSAVKAICNEYKDLGLRLIEIKKKQLHLIPEIIKEIAHNPLKFILFIDDLSFSEDDDDYAALKAALEGSVSSSSPNMAIYATSNRRRLIKETFSSREGDDVHLSDTLQELMSLSERFGLTVTFQRPDKQLYLDVVKALAIQYEIKKPMADILREAEVYTLYRGGRSPRVAKQFIEHLKGIEE
ncbi:MAG: ATP-binding protein [Clostridiales bacterium]|nr:ATP-binding protein [Clostridiales bacterium]